MTGRRTRNLDERRQSEARVDAELDFHRDATVGELVAAGLTRADAEREASRRFGHGAQYRSRLVHIDTGREHAERRRETMSVIVTGVREALRDLRRSPGFTWGVVAMLTIGLGINAITFGLVDRLVLRGPAGVVSPGELRRVVVHRRSRQGAEVATTTIGYLDYRDLIGTTALAGAAAESSAPLLAGSGESAERLQARLVTAGYFPLEPDVLGIVNWTQYFWASRRRSAASSRTTRARTRAHDSSCSVTPSGSGGSAATRVR